MDRVLNLEKNFDDMLRRLESYEVDIIRLRAINAAKDTELASLRDQLQVFSEVKDVIADILTDLPHPVPAPSQQLLQQPVPGLQQQALRPQQPDVRPGAPGPRPEAAAPPAARSWADVARVQKDNRQQQNSPVQIVMYRCKEEGCNIEFNSDANLAKHVQQNHIRPNQKLPIPVVNSAPKINGKEPARNYNCHECSFQGTSSKNLLQHVRSTSHKADDLTESCYTCGVKCNNFDALMVHREQSHGQKINECRHYKENKCNFGDSCWYRHEDKNISTSAEDFPPAQNTAPPDQLQEQFTAVLSSLQTIFMQLKESSGSQARSHGR